MKKIDEKRGLRDIKKMISAKDWLNDTHYEETGRFSPGDVVRCILHDPRPCFWSVNRQGVSRGDKRPKIGEKLLVYAEKRGNVSISVGNWCMAENGEVYVCANKELEKI